MPAPGMHPVLPRRAGAPHGTPVRSDAAPPGRRAARGKETGRRARPPRPLRRFLRETRAAVGITAAAVSIMVLGAAALIGDHLWMVGKRDLLQRAADAAAIAASSELRRRPDSESDAQVEAALRPLAERYARFNVLGNTAGEIEPEDIEVTLEVDRAAGTVEVSVKADVAGTLFAKLLYGYEGPGEVTIRAGAERETTRAEVVLAMDVTESMVRNLAGVRRARQGEPSRMEIVRRAAHLLVDILDPGDEESMIAVGVVPWHINVRLNETMRADWERNGWAVYPVSKTYPWPYRSDGSSRPPAETWPMPPKPEDWKGCLDQRALRAGNPPPGLGTALPSAAPFTMAFFPVMPMTSYQCRDLSSDSFSRGFIQTCYHGPTFEETSTPCPGTVCGQTRETPQRLCTDNRGDAFAPILPLSRDMGEVRRTIDALKPVAGTATYSTMGLIWGRRLLTPEWRPVWGGEVHPVDPDDEDYLGVRKAIVAADRRRGQLRRCPRRRPQPSRRVHRGQARRDRDLRRRGDEPRQDRQGTVDTAGEVLQPGTSTRTGPTCSSKTIRERTSRTRFARSPASSSSCGGPTDAGRRPCGAGRPPARAGYRACALL